MLSIDKKEKSSTDLIIEKSIQLFGFTPSEKSDENEIWMRKNGYLSKKVKRTRRGIRGRR
jgi:hypothetical protein